MFYSVKLEHGLVITMIGYFYPPLPPYHIDSHLVTFDIHLNVRKSKYLATRNRLLPGKAGPTKILMISILHMIYLGNASYLTNTFRVT